MKHLTISKRDTRWCHWKIFGDWTDWTHNSIRKVHSFMRKKWSCCLCTGMYVCYSDNTLFVESGLRLNANSSDRQCVLKSSRLVSQTVYTGDRDLWIHIVYTVLPDWQAMADQHKGAHLAVDGGGATWKAGSFSKMNKEFRNEVSSVRGRSVGGGGGGDGGSWHTWDTGEVEPHVKKAHRQWFNVTKFNYWSGDLGSDWRYLYFTWIWSSHSTLYFYSTTCQRDILYVYLQLFNYLCR